MSGAIFLFTEIFMSIVVGLDVGGSTTKIVGMKNNKIVAKCIVKANDPVTSAFGALGRLIDENNLKVSDVSRVNITGVGASFSNGSLLGIDTRVVTEFMATGLGGLYLSGLDKAVVVSMGTGTAYLDASYERVRHIIGSGVGGGTLVGLSNSVIHVDDAQKLSEMALNGDINKVDLTVGDISKSEIPGLPMDTTASNFGKNNDDLSKEDKIAGIMNLVYQSIGTVSVLAARNAGLNDIVLTGQLTSMSQCMDMSKAFSNLYRVNFIVPEDAVFATAVGSCIVGEEN